MPIRTRAMPPQLVDPRQDNLRAERALLDLATAGGVRGDVRRIARDGLPRPRKRPALAGSWGDDAGPNLARLLAEFGLITDLSSLGGLSLAGRDVIVAVDYRTSTAGNVTSTTGTNIASLSVAPTLIAGKKYALFCTGVINSNAPSGGTIFASAHVDGDQGDTFGWSDTGTVGGERALAFAGFKLDVAGVGAMVTMACHMKVSTGTGTVNAGAILGVAVEME